MNSENVWFDANELAGLPGMPAHPSNVTRKAKSQNWKKRQVEGKKGVSYEYHASSLPKVTLEDLRSREVIDSHTFNLYISYDFKDSTKEGGSLSTLLRDYCSSLLETDEELEALNEYFDEEEVQTFVNAFIKNHLRKNNESQKVGDEHAISSDLQPSQSNTITNNDICDDFAFIPGYSIQVSAGQGALNGDQEKPTRYLAFRKKWLKFRGFSEKDLAIVWAKGDSMEPTIHNNDTVVVHTGRTTPHDGHMYIFRDGDQLFVKRYQSALGTWRLISDNPVYPPLDIKKEEQHQFEVVGQVVHIAKDFGE